MGKGINHSTLRANRENKRLGKEGRSPMWVSQWLKRNSLVHLSIVDAVVDIVDSQCMQPGSGLSVK